jgi:hypothetical protein
MAHKQQKLPGKFTFFNVSEYWNFLNNSNQALGKYADILGFVKEEHKNESNYEKVILIDCTMGAAGFYRDKIKSIFEKEDLSLTFINTTYKQNNFLNEFCGSDFILKERNLPFNYPDYDKTDQNTLFIKNISFDGDVDRIVYL